MANTVKMKALRPLFGVYGKIAKDQEFEASETHAKRYHQQGKAVPANYKMAKTPQNKMEGSPANKAAANPSAKSPTGSPTGEAKRSSSSQADQAPKKQTSRKSKDDAE